MLFEIVLMACINLDCIYKRTDYVGTEQDCVAITDTAQANILKWKKPEVSSVSMCVEKRDANKTVQNLTNLLYDIEIGFIEPEIASKILKLF